MHSFSDSSSYFEISIPVGLKSSNAFQGRFFCAKAFLGLLLFLPIVLSLKICKTFFRWMGVSVLLVGFILTLGVSTSLRDVLMRRLASLAADLADWLLFPFALFTCCSRLLLASFIGPSLFLP